MPKYTEVEIFIRYDAEGQYVAHEDDGELSQCWEDRIGTDAEGIRTVKVVLRVPLPTLLEARGEITSEDEAASIVSAQ